MRAHRDAEFSTVLEQRKTAEAVVEGSRRRLSNRSVHSKPEILDRPSYVVGTKAKNPWAKAAAEFDANLS
jgi:hypothetical protein